MAAALSHRCMSKKLPVILAVFFITTQLSSLSKLGLQETLEKDLLPTFELPPSYPEPAHLAELDPAVLRPLGRRTIDDAHRHGLIHAGAWLHILDADSKLLVLQKRGPQQLVTNAWGLVGEHAQWSDASPLDTAQRCMREELGVVGQRQTRHVQQLTSLPVYYVRNYNNNNNGRRMVDRQVTYMWYVQLRARYADIRWEFDEEVANHRFVSLPEFREWLQRDMALDSTTTQDFGCPESQALLLFGVERLLSIVNG